MKRWIALPIAVTLLCLTMSVAWGESLNDGLLVYSVENGQTTVCGFLDDDQHRNTTALTIPATINGCPVVAVGEEAFRFCNSLTSITLPNGLTTIGEYAFANCDSLTSITLPGSLTTIEEGAFASCGSLTSITLPDGLTTIGDCAFADCHWLTSITLPDGLTTIGDSAFAGCISLTSITLPNSLTTIGNSAFERLSHLSSFVVAEGNSHFSVVDGVLFTADGKTLVSYPSGKVDSVYTVPDGTEIIGDDAFYGSALMSVTLPNGLTTIEEYAFRFCNSLTSITLPGSLTTIEEGAFASCGSLTSITLPNGLITIGDSAFNSCDSLTSVTLPGSLTTIGESAFTRCFKLTTLTVPATVVTIGKWAFENVTLRGLEDSAIHNYAKENGLTFEIITEEQMKQEVTAVSPVSLWVGFGGGVLLLAAASLFVVVLVLHSKKKNKQHAVEEPLSIPSAQVVPPVPVETQVQSEVFCGKCGTKNKADEKFCCQCGLPIK